MADLAVLDLSHNELPTIPDALLTLADSWTALDFSYNDLTAPPSSIADTVVEGYMYALLIHLSDWFGGEAELFLLFSSSFNHNKFVEVDTGAFAGASSIVELRVASNGIFTVHANAFTGMSSLQKL